MNLTHQDFLAFLGGARDTLIYCAVSFPLALFLGLILALMSGSHLLWLKTPARIFIEVMRSTPMLTQLFLLYYGVGAVLVSFNLAQYDNAWVAGITSLALNYAAYEAEIFRAGMLSVDYGQIEAALSLGFTKRQSFLRIVLPQAIPLMIPPFVNDFIYMLKDSSVVSIISGTELTAVLSTWVSHHGSNPFAGYALAIVLYLLLSLPTSYLARLLEQRLRANL